MKQQPPSVTSDATLADYLKTLPLHLLPHHLLSRGMLHLTRVRRERFKNAHIDWFIRQFDVDMSIAREEDPHRYEHFNAFFTRTFKNNMFLEPVADLPWLAFFQGGPGFGSPRPEGNSGWIKRALQDYRVLLLDQRGTARSTPINYQTLARFGTSQAQADYLKHFRTDSIVRDA